MARVHGSLQPIAQYEPLRPGDTESHTTTSGGSTTTLVDTTLTGTAASYIGYGVPVSLSLILALSLATTDRFILAGFLGDSAVGVYQAGYTLSNRTLDVLFLWLGAAGGSGRGRLTSCGGSMCATSSGGVAGASSCVAACTGAGHCSPAWSVTVSPRTT